jgi:hypothetical protein
MKHTEYTPMGQVLLGFLVMSMISSCIVAVPLVTIYLLK